MDNPFTHERSGYTEPVRGAVRVDADQLVADAAGADQHASVFGVAQGVGHQVGEDAFHQHRVGVGPQAGGLGAQAQAPLPGQEGELVFHALEHPGDGETHRMRLDDAGIQPGQVQQGIEQALHGRGGGLDVFGQTPGFLVPDPIFQGRHQQGEGMQGLPQVVAGRRQEAGLGLDGGLRREFLAPQLGGGILDASFKIAPVFLQGLGHAVHAAFQQADFTGRRLRRAFGEMAVGQSGHGRRDGLEGPADATGQPPGQDEGEQDAEGGHACGRQPDLGTGQLHAPPVQPHQYPKTSAIHLVVQAGARLAGETRVDGMGEIMHGAEAPALRRRLAVEVRQCQGVTADQQPALAIRDGDDRYFPRGPIEIQQPLDVGKVAGGQVEGRGFPQVVGGFDAQGFQFPLRLADQAMGEVGGEQTHPHHQGEHGDRQDAQPKTESGAEAAHAWDGLSRRRRAPSSGLPARPRFGC